MSDKVSAFKNELRNLKYYQQQAEALASVLEDMWYDMANVKGVQFGKERSTRLPEYNWKLSNSIEEATNELERIEANIRRINHILSKLDDECRELCEVYISNRHFSQYEDEMFATPSGLQKRLDARLEKIL